MLRAIFIMLVTLTTYTASAQFTAVRVNTLALATGTLNAGVDVTVSDKWSIDVAGSWNPIFDHSTAITAGVKRWRFEPNVGWFWGAHSTYSAFEFDKAVGFAVGAGSSLGYSWILSRRWNFSVEGGLGLFFVHDRWLVPDTSLLEDIVIRHRKRVMLLPSKVEASFSYLF
ncbi:MAG: DUF3575 domain-containing protein [Rikenellaceae bacterium]